tara:strand:+ start:450 stop:605 length:156 start_codon:yes stop_codon:yes gene_type:complete
LFFKPFFLDAIGSFYGNFSWSRDWSYNMIMFGIHCPAYKLIKKVHARSASN